MLTWFATILSIVRYLEKLAPVAPAALKVLEDIVNAVFDLVSGKISADDFTKTIADGTELIKQIAASLATATTAQTPAP